MKEISRLPLDQDLSTLSSWLRSQGVIHKIIESDGEQVLLLADEGYAPKVLEILDAYVNNPTMREHLAQGQRQSAIKPVSVAAYDRVTPKQAPLVFIVIALCVLVAWFTNLGEGGPSLRAFLIVNPFDVNVDISSMQGRWEALLATLYLGDYWRLLTPDLLHFSVLHITFNLLMFWVLGGQLEHRRGTWSLLSLILVVSIASNVAQLLDGGYLFGGLSGVVYGLFGYCWVWARYEPRVFMPDALFRFALIWLIIGYTPLTEWVGLGRMANSAHLYGLLSGLIWAWLVFSLGRYRSKLS